ncbi:radical SAM protein [Actinopolyspora saharensis]|uniref:radical SAM protein n=1 Tax=Actinopolyspora saharensis TaxID=995062 RepID=UPI001C313B06
MTRTKLAPSREVIVQDLSFVWLEITGKCQLECTHCYAESDPDGDHGAMDERAWRHVIDQSRELGAEMVQFIGGEPMLHPALPGLVDYARARGVEVEVFSNLVHVPQVVWDVLTVPGVRLATSYYSDAPDRARRRDKAAHPRPDEGEHRRSGTPVGPAAGGCGQPLRRAA